jgi:hypothetical protein
MVKEEQINEVNKRIEAIERVNKFSGLKGRAKSIENVYKKALDEYHSIPLLRPAHLSSGIIAPPDIYKKFSEAGIGVKHSYDDALIAADTGAKSGEYDNEACDMYLNALNLAKESSGSNESKLNKYKQVQKRVYIQVKKCLDKKSAWSAEKYNQVLKAATNLIEGYAKKAA